MRFLKNLTLSLTALSLSAGLVLAQPVLTPQNPFQPQTGSGINNLRTVSQSADGTEVVFSVDFSYDGFGGRTALIYPVIEKRDQKGVSLWFGADPVTVGQGRGIISLKVKYFNDEPGVPPQLTTDRIRILIVNQSGTALLSSIPFLKTVKWGSPDAKPVPALAATTPAPVDSSAANRLAEEKRWPEKSQSRSQNARTSPPQSRSGSQSPPGSEEKPKPKPWSVNKPA